MRTESVELFRGPGSPGSKAKPIPQPMRPGSDAVRGGASGEARDAKERFQLPDEANRDKRDPARRDDVGDAAGSRSRAGGLGRDEAPGQLLMREILERLGVEGPFKAKAAAGDAGGEGTAPGEANAEAAEGQVSNEQASAEEVAAGQIPATGIESIAMLDEPTTDADVGSSLEDTVEALPAVPEETGDEAAGLADDASTGETTEADAALAAASLPAQAAASDSADADAEIETAPDDTPEVSDDLVPEAEEQANETAVATPDETADAAAAVGAPLLAGASEVGRARRTDGGPVRGGVAHGSEGVASKGPPGLVKRDGLPAQASPVATANVPFAATALAAGEIAAGGLAQGASEQPAAPDGAVEAGNQPKSAQGTDNPGLRQALGQSALGQSGAMPGQAGAIPVPPIAAGEPGTTGPGAQQGLAQALSSVAEAAGKPAPMVPPAPVVPNVPLGAVPIEIGLKALAGVNHFQIRLDPAELGRIDVNLEIDTDGTIKARLTVDRVETLTLLQRDARTLERAFEQAGLKPSDSGVDLSLRDQGRDDRRGPPENGGRDNAPAHARAGGESETNRPQAAVVHQTIWRGAAGVDVRI